MVVRVCMERHRINCDIQIFGTDIDKHAIEAAREGVYLPNIASKVSKERLERYFVKEGERYRVRKEIREPVVFAIQDLLRDPPFTKLHMLFCRNLLIYLEGNAQNRLIPLFHYSLRSEGVLFLGSSETIGRFTELFTPIDRKHVYIKKDVPYFARPDIHFPTGIGIQRTALESLPSGEAGRKGALDIAQATEHLILQEHTPACVIVDSEGHLLHIHGKTGQYLELPSGKPNLDVTALAREGLRFALTSALRKAASSRKGSRQTRSKVKTNGEFEETDVTVIPLSEPQALKDTFLIKFEKSLPHAPETSKNDKSKAESGDGTSRIIEIEQELLRSREDYRSAIEELETSNEELKSVNEEMHSANEELQSTNEELESSREELQSLNEELSTVNSQLEAKNAELAESYASITDVLNSTKIAILFLNNNLTVKRFTPEAASLLNLVGHDTGRPIAHISHNLEMENLPQQAKKVLDTLSPFEKEVRTKDGHWYRLTIGVNRSRKNLIEGIVATFVNIDSQKKAQKQTQGMKEKEIAAAKRFSDSIVDTVRESLLVLDDKLCVLKANRRFYATFHTDESRTEGKSLFILDNGRWNIPRLKSKLKRIMQKGEAFEDLALEQKLPGTGSRSLMLNARRLVTGDDHTIRVLLAVDNISDRKQPGE
jgi:two-component system CheB/CheR fusion protein